MVNNKKKKKNEKFRHELSVLFTNIIKSIWDRNHASLGPENKFKVHANSKARLLFTGFLILVKKK